MPLLHHPVFGTLAGYGQAIELTRQTDGEIADVDHLLHFAASLGRNLTGFNRDEPPEFLLVPAEFLAQKPDELAAAGRRDKAPSPECAVRDGNGLLYLGIFGVSHGRNLFAGQRGPHETIAVLIGSSNNAETLQNRIRLLRETDLPRPSQASFSCKRLKTTGRKSQQEIRI
jgi:hypothetical protein